MGIAIVTGANRGIGLELVRQLRARGQETLAVCRRRSRGLDALDARIVDGCDLTDPASWDRVAAAVGDGPVDLLVQNAGVLASDSLDDLGFEEMRRQMEVNAFAPLLMTRALLPRLRAGAKVALITSRMGSMGDNGSGGYYGYRMSKAALNAAGVSLAIDLAPRGIAVAILHPGAVRTEMTGGRGQIDAEASVRGLLARIDALTLANSGRFLHQDGTELPW